MPRGEPLSPELVMVAPPDEARRAREELTDYGPDETAPQSSDERTEEVQQAWERLGERQVEQVEQAWEQAAVRAAEQLARSRERIATRATQLTEWDSTEPEAVAEPVEDAAVTEAVEGDDAPPLEDEVEQQLPSDWDAFLARARATPYEPAAIEEVPEVSPPSGRSRRTPALIALGVLALALLGGVAWARDWFQQSGSSTSGASSPPIQAPRQPTTSASAPSKPKKRAQKPAARKRTRTTAPRTAPKAPKASKAPKKTAAFVPARVWSWPAARGSSRYRVRFFRNGRKVLDVRTTKPRLVLAKSFTFRNGRYRWMVVPISSDGKGLRPIVDSTFVVRG